MIFAAVVVVAVVFKIFYKLLNYASSIVDDHHRLSRALVSLHYFHLHFALDSTRLETWIIMSGRYLCVNTRARNNSSVWCTCFARTDQQRKTGTFRVLGDFSFFSLLLLLLALFSPLRTLCCSSMRGFLRRDHHASVGEKCDFVELFYSFSYVCKCVCFNNLQLFLASIYLLRDMGILWAALRLINFLFPISYLTFHRGQVRLFR